MECNERFNNTKSGEAENIKQSETGEVILGKRKGVTRRHIM